MDAQQIPNNAQMYQNEGGEDMGQIP